MVLGEFIDDGCIPMERILIIPHPVLGSPYPIVGIGNELVARKLFNQLPEGRYGVLEIFVQENFSGLGVQIFRSGIWR